MVERHVLIAACGECPPEQMLPWLRSKTGDAGNYFRKESATKDGSGAEGKKVEPGFWILDCTCDRQCERDLGPVKSISLQPQPSAHNPELQANGCTY